MDYRRLAIRCAALLVALWALFCLLLAAVNSIDRAAIERGIAASAESPLLTRVYSYDHRVLGTPIAYDNNRFIIEIARQGWAGTPLGTAIAAKIADVERDGAVTEFSYFRYWHGWQVLTTACLALGSIAVIQVAVGALTLAAAGLLLALLKRYIGTACAVAFVVVLGLSTNLGFCCVGDLTLGISFWTAALFCDALLYLGLRARALGWRDARLTELLVLIVIAAGGVYCFLDFLTVPAAVLALTVFCALIASGASRDVPARLLLVRFVAFTLVFMLGFVLTWALKWVLAAAVMGFDKVAESVSVEMALWIDHGGGNGLPQPDWPAALQSFYRFSPRLFALVVPLGYITLNGPVMAASFAVGIVLFVLVVVRAVRRRFLTPVLVLMLPACFVPLYTLIMSTHAIVHIPVFSSRGWAVSFAIAICIGLVLELERGRSAAVIE